MKWHPLLLTLFCFHNCSTSSVNYVARVKVHKLSDADIYNPKMAFDVLFDAEELNTDSLKNKSRKLFLQAIDQFKNKKNPGKAVALFKSSIMTLPDPKTYYELGNALMESSLNEEAIKAFDVAEELNFAPVSLIYYKQATAHASLKEEDFSSTAFLIRRAFESVLEIP